MTKKKLPPYSPQITNPEADAIDRLEAIGVRVEDTGGVWFVKRARDGAILPGTDPLRGYASRGRALTIAVATCSALMDCQRATNLAYTDYLPVAAGRYTHADPDKFAARYRAAREYERVEASKLGLAIRPDRIAEGMTGRRG